MAREIGKKAFGEGITVALPGQPDLDKGKLFGFEFARALTRAFSSDVPAVETFELYLQSVLDRLQPRRLLLMLDEFDKIHDGIVSGVTSPIVPENIRYLIHTYPGLAVILSGSRLLKRLRESYWSALFGIGRRIEVGALHRKDARLLVTQPAAKQLSFAQAARDLVVDLCACQPFLIQSLCNRIFERSARTGERIVTEAIVRETADEFVEDNEHFPTQWEDAQTDRRRLLLALSARLATGPDLVTFEVLENRLQDLGVPVIAVDLEQDLDGLHELELLRLDPTERGRVYRIAVPLMREWIDHHFDFGELVRRAIRESED
jgi:type I restriction enzyme M protein